MSILAVALFRNSQKVSLLAAILALTVIAANPAEAQTEVVLHSFSAIPDGCYPFAGLLLTAQDALYGTTSSCGPSGGGSVFKIKLHTVEAKDKEKIFYSFGGTPDAFLPEAGLIQEKGKFYGTTCCGGATNHGTIYELNGKGQETILYNFTGGAEGFGSSGTLARDAKGNFYGTAAGGDTACDPPSGCGLVYKVTPAGIQEVLHSFSGSPDGATPYDAGVVIDGEGNLSGTTIVGGTNGLGAVFEVTSSGSESILHSFAGGSDGAYPQAGLFIDGQGNLYGTTAGGGSTGLGTVFEVMASGTEKVLHTFTGTPDGNYPYASVIVDAEGNVYGTTYYGGNANDGTVFKITAAGVESVLYSFLDSPDGAHPVAGVVLDSAGNLYGTTIYGGGTECSPYGCGTVFELTP
jgi:uncharacterized repeat protein (TIGR03803 family)